MPLRKKALIFSALGPQSGCALRARYLGDALRRGGWQCEVTLPRFRNWPYSVEAFLSIPYFVFKALFSDATLAVGIKPYPNCWLALWLMRVKGAEVVLDIDDMDGAWRGGFLGAISRLLQAPAFVVLNKFSTHHEGIRTELRHKGKIVTLAQGVDLSIFQRSSAPTEKILLFTAHLNVACQLDLLMDCVSPWLDRHPDWTLAVAGGGPLLGAYKRRHARTQVLFTGALEPEQIGAWVRRSRVCLSVYDKGQGNLFRVPMKCGEYLAAGKPVISNMIPGLIHLEKFIYSCDADAESFGAQLDRLSSGRGDGREKKGGVWVRKHLSWDRVAADFLGELI